MAGLYWVFFLLAGAAALGVSAYLYSRREQPGKGRRLLAGLRWAALLVLILLLFDPQIPAAGIGGSSTQVLLDASLSMTLPAEPGGTETRWTRAVREAAREARGGNVILFGDEPRVEPVDALSETEPGAPYSRVAPAVRTAAEAGARRAVVLTDGELEDGPELARAAAALGMGVEVRTVAGPDVLANRSLVEVESRPWVEAGEVLEVHAGVTSTAESDDTIRIVLREGDRVRATATLETPAPGRVATTALRFTPEAPDGGGLVRFDLSLEPADAVPDDDRRSIYVYVGEPPAGVALVSFRPDWEPRFLHPVLEQALGLPVRGFLQARPGRYVSLGAELGSIRGAVEDEVRRAVERAELVVLHGLGDDAPAWAREAAGSARRVLVFPAADAGDAAGLPVRLGAASGGDWFAMPDVPGSPLTPNLGGLAMDRLPPLSGLRRAQPVADAWAPLRLARDRRGEPQPLLLAGESDRRRWAVALADGYWQWAFRGGDGRDAYRRLWSALAGWLVEAEDTADEDAVRPARLVAERGVPLRWIVRAPDAESITLRVTAADGAAVLDTVLPLDRDTVRTAPLPPGHYAYEARVHADGAELATSGGPFSVESYSPEFARPAAALEDAPAPAAAAVVGAPARRPLRTSPWPYVLFLVLISVEWVLRRRWGLR